MSRVTHASVLAELVFTEQTYVDQVRRPRSRPPDPPPLTRPRVLQLDCVRRLYFEPLVHGSDQVHISRCRPTVTPPCHQVPPRIS